MSDPFVYAQGDDIIVEEMPPTLTGSQFPPRWRFIRRWKVRRSWAQRPSYMTDLGDRGIDRKAFTLRAPASAERNADREYAPKLIPLDEWGSSGA